MNKKSTGLLLSVLGVLSLVLITAGVTYAFFNYAKLGTTENSITTGSLTFLYDEINQEGNRVKIENALPTADTDGMALASNNNVFNFKVTAQNTGNVPIKYEVTARKDDSSTLAESNVKIYLESSSDGVTYTASDLTMDAGTVKTYGELGVPTTTIPAGITEKLLYSGEVAGETSTYTNNFKLRMWLKEGSTTDGTDYTPLEFKNADGTLITAVKYYSLSTEEQANYTRIAYVNNTDQSALTEAEYNAKVAANEDVSGYVASEQLYMLNGQTFKVRVNVYANATVVSAGN